MILPIEFEGGSKP